MQKILRENLRSTNEPEVARSRMCLGWKIPQHILSGQSCCISKKPVQMASGKVGHPLKEAEEAHMHFFHRDAGFCSTLCRNT